jgi:beta-glucosidase-like glycosyl hydrolase
MGIHISFSPVADVNTTPNNPIIGIRSFGDNPHKVAQKSIALATGLQDAGLIAVTKHFPGHGASVRDSHKTLPRIYRSKEALDSIDIFPFHALIKMNVKGVMVGHLDIPAIDSRKNKPVSTSKAVVSNILQDSLGFSGLVFTDALNMAGITKTTEQPALACFLAGADVLLIPASLSRAVDEMKQAYLEDRYLKQQIARQSITLVKNDSKTFPLTAKTSLTYVSLGDAKDNAFLNALRSYAAVVQLSAKEALQVKKGPVVVAIHADTSTPWTRQYMAKADREFLKKIADGTEVHLVLFSNAYSLHKFTDITKFSSILLAYEQQPVFAKVAAQMLFGVLDPVGKLPVSNRSIN